MPLNTTEPARYSLWAGSGHSVKLTKLDASYERLPLSVREDEDAAIRILRVRQCYVAIV